MSRSGKVFLAALLAMPALAQAQRPNNTMQTRSALLYLDRAEKTAMPGEKEKLFAQALEFGQKAVQADAANSKAWFTLGQIYVHMGDAVRADSALDKAEQLWPAYTKDADTLRYAAYVGAFNKGIAALQQNNLQEAIASMTAAEAVWDKKPTASLNLGNLYGRTNDLANAAASYRRALAIMRGPARQGLQAAEEKQWQEWEEAASFNLAQILAMDKKDAEAAQAYEDYLKTHPTNVLARGNLAVVYTRMGKKDEATRIYNELLAQDLSDEDFFSVGVGLFRGEQYAQAQAAFEKALAKNSAFRDAYYNLAQALYSQIGPLEDARAKAKPAEVKTIDAKLRPLYQMLQDASEKALALDPNNRNVMALLARAYRGTANVVEAAAAPAWKQKTLKVMEAHRDLVYEVTDVQLENQDGNIRITGNFVNLKGTEGQPVTLVVSVLGKDGTVLGSEKLSITTPKAEDQVAFTANVKTDKPIGGWKYEIAK